MRALERFVQITLLVLLAGFQITLLVLLAGCAGKDFVRPAPDAFRLGETRYEQVVAQLGEPRKTGDALTNGKSVKSITYVYASAGSEPAQEGVIPARGLTYYFYGDRLVGHEFISSFRSDSSNFDETKVEGLRKGETTRAAVIQALGPPSASFVPPMVKSTSGEAIGYTYTAAHGGLFSGLKFQTKSLRVSFDEGGVVSDIDYQATESR
jgi:hypothetical protein